MNRLRSARGFFKGKIDGVLEESSGPSMQTGKDKGKTKGKCKGRGRPVVRCKNCGRTDPIQPIARRCRTMADRALPELLHEVCGRRDRMERAKAEVERGNDSLACG